MKKYLKGKKEAFVVNFNDATFQTENKGLSNLCS